MFGLLIKYCIGPTIQKLNKHKKVYIPKHKYCNCKIITNLELKEETFQIARNF